MPSPPPTIGRYEVVRLLGQGAMGRVLLARDPVLGRDVAIKVLRPDLDIAPEVRAGLVARMRHEAQAAARVSHPNLVTLHDMGEDPGVGLFLVFEYVSGANLKERLRGGRLPPHQAARLARELGGALSVAHAAGVLHRDVKPENVMLSPTGAKLADFGIAKIPDSTLTRTGSLVGTPAYCAPEALASGLFSPESDQFSLAATLYEAVSGERAFPGDDAVGVAAKIATEDARPVARRCALPDEVDAVLARGLHKDPARRFGSASEFGDALAASLERTYQELSTPASARTVPSAPPPPAPAPEITYLPPPSQPLRVAVGAATIALVSGLVGYAASRGAPLFEGPPSIASTPITGAASAPSAPSATTPHPYRPPRPRGAPPTATSPRPPASASASAKTREPPAPPRPTAAEAPPPGEGPEPVASSAPPASSSLGSQLFAPD
ncbi:MAG TPA: serine/threonine-protein kinase [Polyangiaceae bacterium]|nr:serine/threonine-protein kinase [Polyangiaceae bacterium]